MTDTLTCRFLAEGLQTAEDIANAIADFISEAKSSLYLAAYDCRLDDSTALPIREALADRRASGVDVRLIYDASFLKPQSHADFETNGGDFADNDHERVEELGLPAESIRAIRGPGLMHQKFIIRDKEAVWTGSMNWTNDSMARMENTVLTIGSPALARYFLIDFAQLWSTGQTLRTGEFRTEPVELQYRGAGAFTDVDFSPGQGEYINEWVARLIRRATQRIVLCSMLINSSKVLNALMDVMDRQHVQVWGVYDRTQMEGVLHQWHGKPNLQWKIDAVERLMRQAEMVGKRSLPYRPGHSHNFMHNKMVIVDNTVIVGSYNLSHAAQENAENMMAIENHALAEDAIAYVHSLRVKFLDCPSSPTP